MMIIKSEGKWELINGIPYAMSLAPSIYHQEINGNLFATVRQALNNCANCKVMMPLDWKINEDTLVQPDLLMICKPYDEGNFITKSPTAIFEILSPSTAKKDRTI